MLKIVNSLSEDVQDLVQHKRFVLLWKEQGKTYHAQIRVKTFGQISDLTRMRGLICEEGHFYSATLNIR